VESWIIIVISLAFSAFFSGIEIAFITANKLRIELESKQGMVSSKIISYFFLNSPARFIGTMLVGNNVALVIYGIMMAALLEPVILKFTRSEITVLISQTFISTLIILFTAEFLPKTLFRINPNKILSFFAIPVLMVYVILYPVVYLTIGLSDFFLNRVLKVPMERGRLIFDRIDLSNYIREVTSSDDEKEEREHEIQIFKNALDFSSLKVRDCLIPRTEIEALEVNSSIDSLKEKFVETGISKVLIYKDSIDEIIGYVHSYEMFKKPASIREVLLPVLIMPETMLAKEALSQFIQEHKSIAVVVDEFGGTAGMLTIEDVMEEIFGEIEDEHDTEELEEIKISDTEYSFAGRLEIDYLNEKYRLGIPVSEDYDTLAGFITTHRGSIPELQEEIKIDHFLFIIEEVSDTKIEKVTLNILEQES
jgi:putative hemolysin